MLEEKLEKRRAMRMQKLEQKHENENKVCEQLKDLDCKLDNVSDSTKKDVQYKSM